MIAPGNLRFDFVIFENPSRFSFDIFGHGNVVVCPGDSAQTIYDAACRITTRSLQNEDPWTVATIDWFCLHEAGRIKKLGLTLSARFAGEGSIRDGLPESAGGRVGA